MAALVFNRPMLITQSLKNLFYPRLCLNCGEWLIAEEEGICITCNVSLPLSKYKLDNKNPVAAVLWGRLPLSFASSLLLFNNQNLAHEILHAIKYKGNKDLARLMGTLSAEQHQKSLEAFDINEIVPIPLHPRKKRIRGFNQAEEFAIGIAEKLNLKCNTKAISRKLHTKTQTHKTREERWENVSDIFKSNNQSLNGKNVLLVDDVITTGATLESCAQTILNQNPKSLGILTIAFAKG